MPIITVKRDDVLSKEEVAGMINIANSPRDKSMIAMLYIFGCRVGEMIKLRRENFWVLNDELYVKIEVEKKEKESGIPFKHIIKVNLNTPFLNYVINHVDTIPEGERVWHISRSQVWRIIKKTNPNAWCHLFRHTRATKLAEIGAKEHAMVAWFGWNDIRPARNYVMKGPRLIEELADKID